MEKNLLVNMGIIKSFYNNKKDLLDIFLPFVEYGIAILNKEYFRISDLQNQIYKDCNIKLPITTLKTLLKKLVRKNIILSYESYTSFKLIYDYDLENLEYKKYFEKVNRDKNKLIYDYKAYYKNENITDEEVMELFIRFLNNTVECVDILTTDYKESTNEDEKIVSVSDYFIYLKNYDDYNYNTFKNMYYGFLLCNLTLNSKYKYIVNDKKVKTLEIIVDSNFIFRILDLQNEMLNMASYELLELLKQYGFSIQVFPETVDEVRRVLSAIYDKMISGEYPPKIDEVQALKIGGVLGAFYRRKWDLYKFQEFIQNLDDEVNLRKIHIINHITSLKETIYDEESYYKLLQYKIYRYLHSNGYQGSNISLEDLKNNKLDVDKSLLSDHDYNSIKNNTKMDVKLINYIEKRRKGKKYKFADCEIIFLTCDNILSNFNFNSHENCKSIPEVVTEEFLTNILWINNPERIGDVPLDLTLSIFQSSKYIKFDVFNKVTECISEYVNKRPEDGKYIGDIFNNQSLVCKLNKINGDISESSDCYDMISDYVRINKEHVNFIENEYKVELEKAMDTVQKLENEKNEQQKQSLEINNKMKNINNEKNKLIIGEELKRYALLKMLKLKIDKQAKTVTNIILIGGLILYSCYIGFIFFFCYKYGLDKAKSLIAVILILPPFVTYIYFVIQKKEFNMKEFYKDMIENFKIKYYKKNGVDLEDYNCMDERIKLHNSNNEVSL